jgi:hypothetical protein
MLASMIETLKFCCKEWASTMVGGCSLHFYGDEKSVDTTIDLYFCSSVQLEDIVSVPLEASPSSFRRHVCCDKDNDDQTQRYYFCF